MDEKPPSPASENDSRCQERQFRSTSVLQAALVASAFAMAGLSGYAYYERQQAIDALAAAETAQQSEERTAERQKEIEKDAQQAKESAKTAQEQRDLAIKNVNALVFGDRRPDKRKARPTGFGEEAAPNRLGGSATDQPVVSSIDAQRGPLGGRLAAEIGRSRASDRFNLRGCRVLPHCAGHSASGCCRPIHRATWPSAIFPS